MKSPLNGLIGAAAVLGAVYTSPERLYQTKEGALVGADDPKGVSLVVGEGGEMPIAKAIELGLVEVEPVTDPKIDKPVEMEIEKKARKAAKAAQPGTATAANIEQADASDQGEHV